MTSRKPRNLGQTTSTTSPQTLGYRLRQRRIELGLTLEHVVAETRIQKAQLQSIENGSYSGLEHGVHTLGFVRHYATLLGLDSKEVTVAYLAQRGDIPRSTGRMPRTRIGRTLVGSRLLTWAIAGLVIAAIAGYLIWQLVILTAPPRLSVSYPSDNQLVSGSTLEVRGHTAAGAEVKVNGQLVYVDENGAFTARLELAEGLNIITVEASNSRNQASTIERSVLVRLVDPPD